MSKNSVLQLRIFCIKQCYCDPCIYCSFHGNKEEALLSERPSYICFVVLVFLWTVSFSMLARFGCGHFAQWGVLLSERADCRLLLYLAFNLKVITNEFLTAQRVKFGVKTIRRTYLMLVASAATRKDYRRESIIKYIMPVLYFLLAFLQRLKRLTHCGRVTQICVFTLQLCRTGDADLRF